MGEGRIGVIGGSGLYGMEGLENIREVEVDTPFGAPSDAYIMGTLQDRELVFLPRHGRGHRIAPSALNYRANIHGFKQLGAEWILSVSAVGSMREDIHPGDLVLPDQFFDRTRGRVSSFFDQDVVVHVTFADPTCAALGQIVYEAASKTEAAVHAGGTYICIEGPQFSTRAESRIYRQWGVDVIGMTNLPEARLAREAELCYVTIAMATDYDCWHESADDVDVEAILTLLHRNAKLAQDVIRHAVPHIPRERSCPCSTALQYAIITAPEMIPATARERFELLLGPYLT
ncbi:MAG: S-methyl-5'-thioadenosine phosphorylase [Candidatus Entotheonella factor]|uniref:S-methyl-5'-thioadenosine phosphorylase n=1 Tax=Entotheonella factor TaxID=1429438 RepID=W4LPG2_ENTF1|nr:MAG: S-methyl-5'-thioadenosine phosphorylase [Candidatus Entotheonella factor]